jgi:hypothetical protein
MNIEEITIKVGGKEFTTIKEILMKSNLFKELLSNENISKEMISIPNRSANNFKKVLNYMIDNQYQYPRNLAYELDYYDIEYDINNLYDPNNDKDKLFNLMNELLSRINIVRCSNRVYGGQCQNYISSDKSTICNRCKELKSSSHMY